MKYRVYFTASAVIDVDADGTDEALDKAEDLLDFYDFGIDNYDVELLGSDD